jgi:HPt (histidine-containing phosphotransfer) domain-containing protein
MLEDDEIRLLLKTFVSKMKKSFPVLSRAVEEMDYSKISLEAHSIKGSAANFRFARLESLSSSMESAARKEDESFEYKSALEEMEGIMAEIMA